MHTILAGLAILGFSSTAALSCPMSADYSTAVDRDLVGRSHPSRGFRGRSGRGLLPLGLHCH